MPRGLGRYPERITRIAPLLSAAPLRYPRRPRGVTLGLRHAPRLTRPNGPLKWRVTLFDPLTMHGVLEDREEALEAMSAMWGAEWLTPAEASLLAGIPSQAMLHLVADRRLHPLGDDRSSAILVSAAELNTVVAEGHTVATADREDGRDELRAEKADVGSEEHPGRRHPSRVWRVPELLLPVTVATLVTRAALQARRLC
jgi:hypothetical protein